MTKKHHPTSRAERLSLREDAKVQHPRRSPYGGGEAGSEPRKRPTYTKRRIKETLKEQETRHALRKAASAASLHELETD